MREVDLKDAAILGALGNSRTYAQYLKYHNDFAAGKCTFCHLDECRYPPIHQIGSWILKNCDMPYANCEHHLLIIYDGHLTDWGKLTRDEEADFMATIRYAEERFEIEGCGVVFRRGAIRRTAATLTHLHGHILVVQLDEDGLPVGGLRAYFAKTREELENCKKWVDLFEKVRCGNLTGVTNGFIVFDAQGYYLRNNLGWRKCSGPEAADLLRFSLDEIRPLTTKRQNPQYIKALHSEETGILTLDGPFRLD